MNAVYFVSCVSVASSLDLLSKIPVLPCLLHSMEEASVSNKNLFDWISSQVYNFFKMCSLVVFVLSLSLSHLTHLLIVFQHMNRNHKNY